MQSILALITFSAFYTMDNDTGIIAIDLHQVENCTGVHVSFGNYL